MQLLQLSEMSWADLDLVQLKGQKMALLHFEPFILRFLLSCRCRHFIRFLNRDRTLLFNKTDM